MSNTDSDEDYAIEKADGDANNSYPTACSDLRVGAYVVMKNRPCKIKDILISAPGKHGASKYHIIGVDVFTDKRIEEITPSSHNVFVPIVKREEYTLCSIDDEFCSLMDSSGKNTRDDLKVPENDIGESMKKGMDEGKELIVTVLSAMNEDMIISVKQA